MTCPKNKARPIRHPAQVPDRNGKIFYTSITSLSHISKVQRVEAPKRAKNLVQGKRRNKVLRESLHQVRGVGAPKRTKNLVQEKRKNKVLREFLHQVQRVGAPKRAKDLVQRKRKNKVLREFLHQVRSRGAAPPPEPDAGNPPLCAFSDPDPLFSRNERSRCTKCTAASSLYYAFFGVASSKAAPSPLVRRPQVRRSPFRLGGAHPRGSALATQTKSANRQCPTNAAKPRQVRQRPTNAAKPSPARPASPAHPAPTSAAAGCAP